MTLMSFSLWYSTTGRDSKATFLKFSYMTFLYYVHYDPRYATFKPGRLARPFIYNRGHYHLCVWIKYFCVME
jgi:hypothetical protein